MNLSTIKRIVENCKDKGYSISIRDISYIILKNTYSDKLLAYKSIYSKDATELESDIHAEREEIVYLEKVINEINGEKRDVKKIEASLTFEENRDALIDMLNEIEEAYDNGEISYKDKAKIVTDIRIKLNDKFGTAEQSQIQYIYVEPKFNFICPHTRKECYKWTKEDLMKEYNLVEKDSQ